MSEFDLGFVDVGYVKPPIEILEFAFECNWEVLEYFGPIREEYFVLLSGSERDCHHGTGGLTEVWLRVGAGTHAGAFAIRFRIHSHRFAGPVCFFQFLNSPQVSDYNFGIGAVLELSPHDLG